MDYSIVRQRETARRNLIRHRPKATQGSADLILETTGRGLTLATPSITPSQAPAGAQNSTGEIPMAICSCEYHDGTWDDDVEDGCPKCEAYAREQEAYWRPLWEGERPAGLVGHRTDDPSPLSDARWPEWWGL